MRFEIDGYNALREALQRMCSELQRDVPEGTLFDSKLVVNELVSNVLQHGGGRAFFSFERKGDGIRISVRGERDYRPPERSTCSETTAERGRGLFLVDTLTESRMYSEEEGICVVLRIEK